MSSEYKGTGYDNWPESSTGEYLRLKKSGESARIRIVGLPIFFKDTFKANGQTKTVNRWAFPVIYKTKVDGQIVREFRGFECGTQIASAIRDLKNSEDWGDPGQYDITVTRDGDGLSTEYKVTPSPDKKPITEEDLEILQARGFDGSDYWAEDILTQMFIKEDSE